MIVRKAIPADSQHIASLLYLAMEEIVFNFIGMKSPEKALDFLNSLVPQKGNQYSYENCWVVEYEHSIVGMACVYNGADIRNLRKPIEATLATMFGKTFDAEDETQADEYYIDCIGVNPSYQGRGIGSLILNFLIDEYVHRQNHNLGLLVETSNPGAKKLYLKTGFIQVGNKLLTGKSMCHLQYLAG